jgi:hypothetical protein
MQKKPQPPFVDEWSGVNEQSGWDWEKPSIQEGRSSSEEAYLKEIRDELRRLRKGTQKEENGVGVLILVLLVIALFVYLYIRFGVRGLGIPLGIAIAFWLFSIPYYPPGKWW